MKKIISIVLALPASAVIIGALWFGLIPAGILPIPNINLKTTPNAHWFDPIERIRILSMRFDKKTCKEVLIKPYIHAVPLRTNLKKNGCGWVNGFKVRKIAGAKLGKSGAIMSCELATSMALWMSHVQDKALELYKSPIVKIHHYGTYNCRKIRNGIFPSQHSFANGIDVSGFTLKNGKTIRVYGNWDKSKKGSYLMRDAYSQSCKYFNVKLGPESNKSHRDHFHLDNGPVISWCSGYWSKGL